MVSMQYKITHLTFVMLSSLIHLKAYNNKKYLIPPKKLISSLNSKNYPLIYIFNLNDFEEDLFK